uniref:Uncharacterized protein n=1 Tax=Acrobeloides nanus TaxID=290746 RepID=A0A914CVQ3_9BILA
MEDMIQAKEVPLLKHHLDNIAIDWRTEPDGFTLKFTSTQRLFQHNQDSEILVVLNDVTHITDMIEEKEAPLLELHLGFTLKFYFNSTIMDITKKIINKKQKQGVVSGQVVTKIKLDEDAPVEAVPSKGISEFWFHVLNNVSQMEDMIQAKEVPLLKHHLDNIAIDWRTEPDGFTLKFTSTQRLFQHNQDSAILVVLNDVTHITDMIEEKEAPLLKLHLENITADLAELSDRLEEEHGHYKENHQQETEARKV